MTPLHKLFDIKNGHSLELNKLDLCTAKEGIAYVSRKTSDNGIAAYVKRIEGLEPAPAGELTCTLSGNGVLSTFIQDREFYTAYHVARLKPKIEMSQALLLYYCLCIPHNRYKYSWGRQANRSLKNLVLPSPDTMPTWVENVDVSLFGNADAAFSTVGKRLKIEDWKYFRYDQIFDIERGRGPRRKDLDGTGATPFVTSSDKNNGLTGFTIQSPIHEGNTIGVNRNGSVAEAFYQPVPFCSTEDVHIFTAKFELNKYVAMFLVTLIKKEKYRYNYGRKWGLERMKKSYIKLPVDTQGNPDWKYMESYIKSLAYSSTI